MTLEEKLISDHIVFDEKYPLHPKWEDMRNMAIKAFKGQGFPTRKDEEWKYTKLSPWIKDHYDFLSIPEVEISYDELRKYFIHNIESYHLVFINGVYNSFLSDTTHIEADVCILSSGIKNDKYSEILDQYFNQSKNHNDPLFALNTAFAKEGAYIHIPKSTVLSRPIQIINFTIGEQTQLMAQPRNLVVVEDFAEVQIIERHQNVGAAGSLTNAVTEIFVGENAFVDYYKVQNDAHPAGLIDHTSVTQKQNSTASVHTFSLGGKFTRNTLNFYQNGSNCNSILKGINILDEDQQVDNHTLVHHAQPNCESHELYRGVFKGKSSGVFNGKVIVDNIAQKIDAYQENNNILLSDHATIDSKPQLEIFADDVKCSHGCTIGQLDEEALFYLRSRGIPLKEAQALLTYAFSSDVLQTVKIPELQKRINKLIANKLEVEFEVDY